jgi:DNA-binding NtrC family response regulator
MARAELQAVVEALDLDKHPTVDLVDAIESLEKAITLDALARTQGNCAQAAKLLGVNRTTLVQRRKKYGFPLAIPCGQGPAE